MKKRTTTEKMFPKEIIDKNYSSLETMEFYDKVSDIIERTYIALGRKSSFSYTVGSTKDSKINTSAIKSTI